MAGEFTLNGLPFLSDSNGVPYIAAKDNDGSYTQAASMWFKNGSNVWVPVSQTDPIPVKEFGTATLLAGTISLADSATPVAASTPCSTIFVQASPDNTVDLFVGNATAQPIQLGPGATISVPLTNTNLLYGKSASASVTLNWLAI